MKLSPLDPWLHIMHILSSLGIFNHRPVSINKAFNINRRRQRNFNVVRRHSNGLIDDVFIMQLNVVQKYKMFATKLFLGELY